MGRKLRFPDTNKGLVTIYVTPRPLADPKGIEPSIFSVTGRRVNRYTTGPGDSGTIVTRAHFYAKSKVKTPREGRFGLFRRLLLHLLHNCREDLWLMLGYICQDLAVELDFRDFERVHEGGVGHAVQASRGIDFDLPEAACVTLLQAAVDVSVAAGFAYRNFGQLGAGFTLPAKTLGSGE